MDYVWNITGKCNLSCPGCWDPFKDFRNATVESLLAGLNALDLSSTRVVTITGGEPLLHKGLAELVRALRRAGVPEVKVCTNGTLLDRRGGELIAAGVTEVHVSLDSVDEDAHASLWNDDAQAASYVIRDQISAFRREVAASKRFVNIVIVAVVDPRRLDRLQALLDYAGREACEVSVQLLCPFSLWTPDVASQPGGLEATFSELAAMLRRTPGVSNVFNQLYLAAARRYATGGGHAPCGAGDRFQVIDPTARRHACFRPEGDPEGMACFDEGCLIWARSQPRGRRILEMVDAGGARG